MYISKKERNIVNGQKKYFTTSEDFYPLEPGVLCHPMIKKKNGVILYLSF